MAGGPAQPVIEEPPPKIWIHDIREMLGWFELNLCAGHFIDPRGHRVLFTPERFPHLIKLLRHGSNKEVNQPQKIVNQIRNGEKRNGHFGGYDEHRAQTLSWIPPIIRRPTKIIEVVNDLFEKAGDTLYLKEFKKDGFKFKVFVCRRVGKQLLVPVTCHPRDHDRFGDGYKIVWP